MQEAMPIQKKILNACDNLPEACSSFLLETGIERAISTRWAYAQELMWFFDYLISYKPEYCDMKKTDFTLDQIRQISSQDITRYLSIYKSQGKKERTISRKRAALSSFFDYLLKNRKIEYNPVLAAASVKIHKADEVVYLDIEEQNRFLDSIDHGTGLTGKAVKHHDKYRLRDVTLITLLLDTGMRVSEVHGIDIKDLDLEDCSVYIVRKGGNKQTIYFSDETATLIDEYIESRRVTCPNLGSEEPLFVTLKGDRLAVRSIEYLVKKYAKAGLPGKGQFITPHKMRSSFAMGYYEETMDILALQKKLGHESLAATNIYAKATDKKMRETRDIMAKRRADVKKSKM